MNQITKINKAYYDRLYRHKNPILHLLHSRISFDQQAKSRFNHDVIDLLIDRIAKKKGKVKILDYGSGWGVYLLNLARASIDAYCFDVSKNAVKSLKSVMRFSRRVVKEIGFDENNNIYPNDFDLIVCSHVLEHVESDKSLLRQLVQALRPGGYLLVNIPINEIWRDPKHTRTYSINILEKLMTSTGLKIIVQRESDKWSGFLIKYEVAYESNLLARLILRALRGLLALLPYTLIRFGEDIFLKSYQPQQLIMLGTKSHG